MTISETKIYPRTGDKQTVYLKSVVKNPNIIVGDYTMYNDFVSAAYHGKKTPLSVRRVEIPAGRRAEYGYAIRCAED